MTERNGLLCDERYIEKGKSNSDPVPRVTISEAETGKAEALSFSGPRFFYLYWPRLISLFPIASTTILSAFATNLLKKRLLLGASSGLCAHFIYTVGEKVSLPKESLFLSLLPNP